MIENEFHSSRESNIPSSVPTAKESGAPQTWIVCYGKDELEFGNFRGAVVYADSLAKRRELIKEIDPDQRIIKLSENKQNSRYEFDYYVHRFSDI